MKVIIEFTRLFLSVYVPAKFYNLHPRISLLCRSFSILLELWEAGEVDKLVSKTSKVQNIFNSIDHIQPSVLPFSAVKQRDVDIFQTLALYLPL